MSPNDPIVHTPSRTTFQPPINSIQIDPSTSEGSVIMLIYRLVWTVRWRTEG